MEGVPFQQLTINGTSATDGGQAFAGIVHGNVNFAVPNVNASRTLPVPSSLVPFRRDPDFVNRGDILAQIDARCSQPAGRAALVGLGGVGKTQMVVEYAHRTRERAPNTWVFWIYASNRPRVEAAYRAIADKLELPGRDGKVAEMLKLVHNWLSDEHNGRWLIILDNADDKSVSQEIEANTEHQLSLAELLPQCDNGAVLMTSRNIDVAREIVGREQDIIQIGTMSEGEALQLLQHKLKNPPGEQATQLLTALELFPLAITQAAAYINRQPRTSTYAYLKQLGEVESKTQVLLKAAPDMRRDKGASNSILSTWQISFEQIRSERPSAAELLSFMSFFDRQDIPQFMLHGYTESRLSHDHGSHLRESEDVDEDVIILHNFSLITPTNEDYFAMHSLVQFATQAWLEIRHCEQRWLSTYVMALFKAFPHDPGEHQNWATCRALLPHVQSLTERRPLNDDEAYWLVLMIRTGEYLNTQGSYSQAEVILRRTLRECEERLGLLSPATILNVNDLALVLQNQGKYQESEQLNRRALTAREKEHGTDAIGTLLSINNLASVLQSQAKYDEAEGLYWHAVEGLQKLLGSSDPRTLLSVDNLAMFLTTRGKHGEAEPLQRDTLATREKVLGLEHPNTLLCASNLASTWSELGKSEQAEALQRRVLMIYEESLEANHPLTLTVKGNLAATLSDRAEYAEAEDMNREVLAAREQLLGELHPTTLHTLVNLADILRTMGEYSEAELLLQRAVTGFEQSLGAEHPDTWLARGILAYVMHALGKDDLPESMCRRLVSSLEEQLGRESFRTLRAKLNLGRVLQAKGKFDEAWALNAQVIQVSGDNLGMDHRITLLALNNQAMVLHEQGKHSEARLLAEQALAGFEKTLGINHPSTLASMSNLASTFKSQGEDQRAISLLEKCAEKRGEVLGPDHPDTKSCDDLLEQWQAESAGKVSVEKE